MPAPRLPLTSALCLLLGVGSALAQTRAPAQARRAEPAPSCTVSEFRAMALATHDLAERSNKAVDWLRRQAAACNEEQLRLLRSNHTAWLGNADSPQIMGLIDMALEARLKGKPELITQMFGAAPAKVAATSDTLRAGDLAPRPAPVLQPGTPAVVQGAPMAVPVPVVVPGGNPPPPAPEPGKAFTPAMRKAVKDYFTANRGNDACPPDLILKAGKCEAALATRAWAIGKPLPASVTTKPLPARLGEELGLPPKGHSYVLAGADLLLVADDSKNVVDAVVDLGGIEPKADATGPAGAKPAPARTPAPKA